MQVHHLSHIDLDGYGAQFVAKHCFSEIYFYNANYGREVGFRLGEILEAIKASKQSDFLILITDLNLTLEEAKMLQGEVNALNAANKGVKLRLLDHHITGQDCADSFSWYFLDSSICASKITLQTLRRDFCLKDSPFLEPFIEMINSADTWSEGGFGFDFGKVAMGMIAQSKEFSRLMFDDFDRAFKFNMLDEARKILLSGEDSRAPERPNVAPNVALDNEIFFIKKRLLGGDKNTQTMEEILSNKQVELLGKNKADYAICCNGKKGLLTYGVGGISVVANQFLKTHSDFDFFLDLSPRGGVSLRSNGACDVSEIAKDYFKGGGHKNASGGRFERFRETFSYADAREQVLDLFEE